MFPNNNNNKNEQSFFSMLAAMGNKKQATPKKKQSTPPLSIFRKRPLDQLNNFPSSNVKRSKGFPGPIFPLSSKKEVKSTFPSFTAIQHLHSKQSNPPQVEANNSLKKENAALKKENDVLKEEVKNLNKKVNLQETQIKTQTDQYAQLQLTHQDLIARFEALAKDNQILQEAQNQSSEEESGNEQSGEEEDGFIAKMKSIFPNAVPFDADHEDKISYGEQFADVKDQIPSEYQIMAFFAVYSDGKWTIKLARKAAKTGLMPLNIQNSDSYYLFSTYYVPRVVTEGHLPFSLARHNPTPYSRELFDAEKPNASLVMDEYVNKLNELVSCM